MSVIYCALLPHCVHRGNCRSIARTRPPTVSAPVVDVYQQWCGPCRAVVSLLRKIKNELSDDLLHFATVSPEKM